jgi:uncharacterized integral membrane protein
MYERREPDRVGDDRSQRSGVSPVLVVLGIVAILAVIFIAQNSERANIDFLFLDFSSPVWVALLIAIGLGIVLDRLLMYWWNRRRRRDVS